jgi:hypothetical protein
MMIDDDGNGRRTLSSLVGTASKWATKLNSGYLNALQDLWLNL